MVRNPIDCPYYLVSRATLVVTSALRKELREAGVDNVRPAYLGVLLALWREDGLRSVDLGKIAGLEPSTMTGLLDRMERDGLLARSADPEDRRAHRISLTDAGRAACAPVSAVVDRALSRMLEGIDPSEIDRLKVVLRQVLANADRGSEA